MLNVRNRVPKYRRHKGSGQALVEVNGRRYYLGPYGTPKSKEQYARIVAELSASPSDAPGPAHRQAGLDHHRGAGRRVL